MITRFSELHSLIIYVVFGYALLFPLVLASLRIFDISRPVQRLRIYLVAFLTPIIAFLLYHTILVKRCASGLGPLWSESAFHLLCVVSEGMLRFFLPLLGIFTVLAAFKAIAAVLMIKRLENKAVAVDSKTVEEIDTLVITKSQELGISPPRVIFSRRIGFAAFTTGFFRPVIVINAGIVGFLDKREMEAVISHELIHIGQSDTLKNWLLHLVRDITMLNPLSALLLRGYLLEKEVICDQKAAELANQTPGEYAATLLKVWRSIIDCDKPGLAVVTSYTGGSGMERRIEALLDSKHDGVKHSGFVAAFSGIFIFSVTLLFLGLIC